MELNTNPLGENRPRSVDLDGSQPAVPKTDFENSGTSQILPKTRVSSQTGLNMNPLGENRPRSIDLDGSWRRVWEKHVLKGVYKIIRFRPQTERNQLRTNETSAVTDVPTNYGPHKSLNHIQDPQNELLQCSVPCVDAPMFVFCPARLPIFLFHPLFRGSSQQCSCSDHCCSFISCSNSGFRVMSLF